jgi:hypothetical protein
VLIDVGVLRDRRPVEHVGYIVFNLVKFSLLYHPGEHVEAVTAVRVNDVGVKVSAVGKTDRPPVIQRKSAEGAAFSIGNHLALIGPVVNDRYFNQRKVYSHRFPQASRRIY